MMSFFTCLCFGISISGFFRANGLANRITLSLVNRTLFFALGSAFHEFIHVLGMLASMAMLMICILLKIFSPLQVGAAF